MLVVSLVLMCRLVSRRLPSLQQVCPSDVCIARPGKVIARGLKSPSLGAGTFCSNAGKDRCASSPGAASLVSLDICFFLPKWKSSETAFCCLLCSLNAWLPVSHLQCSFCWLNSLMPAIQQLCLSLNSLMQAPVSLSSSMQANVHIPGTSKQSLWLKEIANC